MVRDFTMRIVSQFLIALFLTTSIATADIRQSVQNLFDHDMATLDIARVKIEVDRLLDPSIDMDEQLAQIDEMVSTIKQMLPRKADSWAKVEAIRRYIYQPGPWNGNRAFRYDHDDPYGLNLQNKLLSDYMDDRLGNCITMPFLFIILGQRLGLDVTASVAPLHVFVKFTDDDGMTHNLEATSGAGRARDAHYRRLLPITDAAVANGVFLKSLSREEIVTVIATVLLEDLINRKRYHDAMAVADILLTHYPNYAYVMVKKGTAAYYLLKTNFYDNYADANDVPGDQRPYLAYLQRINQNSFDRADNLGWKEFKRSASVQE